MLTRCNEPQLGSGAGTDGDRDVVRRPSRVLLAAEAPRALIEFGVMTAVRPLLDRAPRGDGHPVVVLPGFVSADRSTGYLRRFLRSKGYYVHGWGLGTNIGPTPKIVRGLEDRFAAVSEMHGRKCSVIGWSLGGGYARGIARDKPDLVRQVITLGTPLRLDSLDQLGAGRLFRALSSRYDPGAMTIDNLEVPQPPPSVPSSAIYSRSDGFTPWQLCQDAPGPNRESIAVRGSHCGLGHNPAVLAILAQRLAQPEGEWEPFAGSPLSRTLGIFRSYAATP